MNSKNGRDNGRRVVVWCQNFFKLNLWNLSGLGWDFQLHWKKKMEICNYLNSLLVNSAAQLFLTSSTNLGLHLFYEPLGQYTHTCTTHTYYTWYIKLNTVSKFNHLSMMLFFICTYTFACKVDVTWTALNVYTHCRCPWCVQWECSCGLLGLKLCDPGASICSSKQSWQANLIWPGKGQPHSNCLSLTLRSVNPPPSIFFFTFLFIHPFLTFF